MNRDSKIDRNIYLLPNLMTAGNLFCGFYAILLIFQGIELLNLDYSSLSSENSANLAKGLKNANKYFELAIYFIFGSCIFDLLDGRLARLGGKESLFGKEFDSIADVVSFGVAPSLLVYRVVLRETPDKIGMMIAFFYLLCGALRLARFNSAPKLDNKNKKNKNDDFIGFPIPAAAGVIVSITHFLLWMFDGEKNLGLWKYLLPVIMLMVSAAMMSSIRFPSFKNINWATKKSSLFLLLIVFILLLLVFKHEWMPMIFFLSYFFYGVLKPFFKKKKKKNSANAI